MFIFIYSNLIQMPYERKKTYSNSCRRYTGYVLRISFLQSKSHVKRLNTYTYYSIAYGV